MASESWKSILSYSSEDAEEGSAEGDASELRESDEEYAEDVEEYVSKDENIDECTLETVK